MTQKSTGVVEMVTPAKAKNIQASKYTANKYKFEEAQEKPSEPNVAPEYQSDVKSDKKTSNKSTNK